MDSPDPLALAVERLERCQLHSNHTIRAELIAAALDALRRARERAEVKYLHRFKGYTKIYDAPLCEKCERVLVVPLDGGE